MGLIPKTLLSEMADKEEWYFKPKTGRIYTILKNGIFHQMVFVFDGYHLNDPNNKLKTNEGEPFFDNRYPEWEILPNKWGKPEALEPETFGKYKKDTIDRSINNEDVFGFIKDKSERKKAVETGIVYMGGSPVIYRLLHYTFKWLQISSDGTIHPNTDPNTNHLRFVFSYVFVIPRVRTGGKDSNDGKSEMLSLSMIFFVQIYMRNPYKAQYTTGASWFVNIQQEIASITKDYTGTSTLELINDTKHHSAEELTKSDGLITSLKTHLNEYAIKHGIFVEEVKFENYLIEDEEIAQSAEKSFKAMQDAKVTQIQAEAEALKIETEAKAKSSYYLVIDKLDNAKEILEIEKFEKLSQLKNLRAIGSGTGLFISDDEKENKKTPKK